MKTQGKEKKETGVKTRKEKDWLCFQAAGIKNVQS